MTLAGPQDEGHSARAAAFFSRHSRGMPSWGMVLLVLLAGCVTDASREAREAGSAGGVSEQREDAFQWVQETSGLEEEAWHAAGVALSVESAHRVLAQLAQTPVTRRNFAPRRVLCWLLGEVLVGGERVEYADLKWRAERFGMLVLVRPDGYLVTALTGTPLQRMGTLQLDAGRWRVGSLVVGDFYFSQEGVFYPVTAALRRGAGPPVAELGLGRDPFNAALDGAEVALAEMVVALTQAIVHPLRTVEDLARLPSSVARLIASSPEYFALYGAMSREDQIREAARLSTHVLMMFGGGEATMGRVSGLGAELPVLSLTTQGEVVLLVGKARGKVSTVGVETGLGVGSILHMAGTGPGRTSVSGGTSGPSSQKAPPKAPGKWTYKKPTTDSAQALDYQEQVTGRPAWYVYMVGKVEFDGFNGVELLEAKGASYKKFLKNGKLRPWFEMGEGFEALRQQARRQSELAKALNLPVVWHVAEAEFASFLGTLFEKNGWDNITVRHTPAVR